jgi:hypothetical protein
MAELSLGASRGFPFGFLQPIRKPIQVHHTALPNSPQGFHILQEDPEAVLKPLSHRRILGASGSFPMEIRANISDDHMIRDVTNPGILVTTHPKLGHRVGSANGG